MDMKATTIAAAVAALSLWPAAAQAQDVDAGAERYAQNCVNCHGREGRGMASFPSIAGHEADYLADRLRTYRAREMVGPNSAIMMSLAQDLTDAEVADLAAYISATFTDGG